MHGTSEPFAQLLTQGMVQGLTYTVPETGKFVLADQVETRPDGSQVERTSGRPVVASWAKMSKSKGNGVKPEDVIAEFGVDTARVFVLFKAPPEMALNWDTEAIQGVHRWLQRVWLLFHPVTAATGATTEVPPVAPDAADPAALAELARATNTAIAAVTLSMGCGCVVFLGVVAINARFAVNSTT